MDELLAADEPALLSNSTSLSTMSRFTPSIAGSLRSRRPCGGWARWSRAASNRRRWSALWPRKCAGAWVRITAGLWRFETSAEITLVAAAADPAALAKWPVGTRTPIEGNTLATVVQRTGLPARIDSYENIAGAGRRTRACGGHPRGGGSSDHRRRQRAGLGGRRFRRNLAPCRPTQRRASAGSPN